MTMDHRLERRVIIRAPRETVFAFFLESERFARWWGEGSEIDPRPGGRVLICYPGGTRAGGEVLEIDAPNSIKFSFGYESGEPIGAGASQVSISLSDHHGGTLVQLEHCFDDSAARDAHVAGWRYQLSVFANVVTAELASGFQEKVDAWFAAWAERDSTRRARQLAVCCSDEFSFRDAYGCILGIEDLNAHIDAVQQHMPDTSMTRQGDIRFCQGTAVVDWKSAASGASGTNVCEMAANGRIEAVTGFWNGD